MTDYTQLTDEDLWARVNDVSGVDRIDMLVELGDRAFQAGEFAAALTLLSEACSAVEQVDDRQWFAEILHGQGAAAFHAGQLDVAVDSYGQAAHVFHEIGMLRPAAHAFLCQADAHSSLGNFEQCLAAAREAGVLAEYGSDSALAGEACYLQAAALQRLGRDQEALGAYRACGQHFQQAGCPERVMQSNDLVAAALLRLGQVYDALEAAREGLTLVHRSKADASLAHFRLAEVLQSTGQHARAVEEAEAAQREYRKAGDLAGEAASHWLRAHALMDLRRYHDAQESLEQARMLFAASGKARQALFCQVDLAFAWQALGELGEAERIHRYLAGAFTELDPESADAQFSAVRLLDNLIAQRRYEECCIAAEDAMVLWPEGSTAATLSYREFLGRWTWALHKTGRVAYAVAMAAHVINRAPQDLDSPALANCYEVRGRYRVAQRQPGALQDLLRASSAHLTLGQPDRAGDLASHLARAATDTHDAAHPAPSTPLVA